VNIIAATLTGSGIIEACGAGSASAWNGSGGGRVAVALTSGNDFGDVDFRAWGGTTRRKGAAGTIYIRTADESYGTLVIDNNSQSTSYDYLTTLVSSSVSNTDVGTILIRNAAKFQLDDGQSITTHGSWSNNATFFGNSGSQVILAGTNSATLYGDTTFASLVCTNGGKSIYFNEGSSNQVSDGLTLQGASGNLLDLNSTSEGHQWYITVQTGKDQLVSYVIVRDSNALGGDVINAASSTNEAHNDGWNFAGPVTVTWTGAEDTNWGNTNNWDIFTIPAFWDTVVIPNRALNPVLDTSREVASLTNETDATLSLAGYDLIVSGDITVAGTLIAAGSEQVTLGSHANFTSGVFVAAESTVVFNGSSTQIVQTGEWAFHNLTVVNESNPVKFEGGFSADLFSCEIPDASLVFDQNGTYNIHALTLRGDSGTPVVLSSSQNGDAWVLNLTGWQHVRYVDVRDSDATAGRTIYARNSTDSTGNTNWSFSSWSSWNGSQDNVFTNADNWTPSGALDTNSLLLIDGNGAAAPIVSSSCTMKRLIIGETTASTLTVNTNLIVLEDLLLLNYALLTHQPNGAVESYKLILDVGRDFTVSTGAVINVNGKGYAGGLGAPVDSSSGASYGGQGSAETVAGRSSTYGSVTSPVSLGSRGGGGAIGGGCAIINIVEQTTIEGTISANGNNGGNGAASGGTVSLRTGSLEGKGTISANGGNSVTGWNGGGGGRILVSATNTADISNMTITAYGGTTRGYGAAGTIYIQLSATNRGTLLLDNNDVDTRVYLLSGELGATTLITNGVSDAVVDDVTIRNAAKLHVGGAASLTVQGDWTNSGTLVADTNSTVIFAGTNESHIWTSQTFYNLSITNTQDKIVQFAAGTTNTITGTLSLLRATLESTVIGSWCSGSK